MSQPSHGTPGSSGEAPNPTQPQSDAPAPPQPSTGSQQPPQYSPQYAPQYSSEHPPQYAPQYPPPQSPAPVQQGPMSPQDERNWAMGAHLSALIAAVLSAGLLIVLGPLVVMLVNGNRSAFVRRHAVEALNWTISSLIYFAVSIVLSFVLIGIPMLIVLAICFVVFTIMGAMAASRGQEYRYPLTLRFVK